MEKVWHLTTENVEWYTHHIFVWHDRKRFRFEKFNWFILIQTFSERVSYWAISIVNTPLYVIPSSMSYLEFEALKLKLVLFESCDAIKKNWL